MTKAVWMGMQPDETVAVADCGCTLYRSGDDAPEVEGAGGNDDPLYVQCALHEAAPDLLVTLREEREVLETWQLWGQNDPDMREGIRIRIDKITRAIEKAEGRG